VRRCVQWHCVQSSRWLSVPELSQLYQSQSVRDIARDSRDPDSGAIFGRQRIICFSPACALSTEHRTQEQNTSLKSRGCERVKFGVWILNLTDSFQLKPCRFKLQPQHHTAESRNRQPGCVWTPKASPKTRILPFALLNMLFNEFASLFRE